MTQGGVSFWSRCTGCAGVGTGAGLGSAASGAGTGSAISAGGLSDTSVLTVGDALG